MKNKIWISLIPKFLLRDIPFERGCGSWFYYKLLSKNERGGVLAILLSKGN